MERMRAIYELRCEPADVDALAAALAVEQSVEMPVTAIRQPAILRDIVGQVESIEPQPAAATDGQPSAVFRVVLGLAAETVGSDPAQLINMAFGNASLQDHVRLVDLELPDPVRAAFTGPRFGVAGLRALVGAPPSRALTCTALKPQGMSATQLAELAYTFAGAGIDIVKDDHGLANQSYAPFGQRVAACAAAVRRANERSGTSTVYAPSLVGRPRDLAAMAAIARDEGVRVVLVAPLLVGAAAFCELVEDHLGPAGIAVIAHPAFGGAARVDPVLAFAKLFRLFGADASIFPNYGGRFSYSPQRCADLAAAARDDWHGYAPMLPVPAGGMTVERVGELLSFFGVDTMLLIGGNLLAAGDALAERSRMFTQAVAAIGR